METADKYGLYKTTPGFRLLRYAFIGLLLFTLESNFHAFAVSLNSEEQAIAGMLTRAGGQRRPSLKLNATLTQVARARANDMANRGYFAHVNPNGQGANYLIKRAGYKLPEWWGNDKAANYVESIAAGRASASATWDDWMNSPGHKDHLLALNSFYTTETNYGVGFAHDTSSPYIFYWVVITAPPEPDPLLTVSDPDNNLRTTVASVPVSGKTSTESNTAKVVFRVENGNGDSPYVTAAGTTDWSGTVTGLAPGPNFIRIRSLKGDGSVIDEVLRSVTCIVVKPLTVSVSGNGRLSSDFLGTTDREVGRRYTVTARPGDDALFAGWTGSVTSSERTLDFTMTEGMKLQANFVPNPYRQAAGGFTGVADGASSTMARVRVSGSGAFTGSLRYEGEAYALRGALAADGTGTYQINRRGQSPLLVTLACDLENGTGIKVTVTDGGASTTIDVAADFRARTGDFEGAGRYTISLPQEENTAARNAAAPAETVGNGWATLSVTRGGRTRLAGTLANGTRISVGGTISGRSTLPIFIALSRGKGELAGTLQVQKSDVSDVAGRLHWSQPAERRSRMETTALDLNLQAVGSLYEAPRSGTPVLDLPLGINNSQLVLNGGDLSGDVVQQLTIEPTNRVTSPDETPARPRLTINARSGFFSGSFTHPATGKRSAMRGVILQKQNAGYGYFGDAEESGSVALAPAN